MWSDDEDLTAAMATRPAFPVLCLSKDNSMSVAASTEALSRANALAFFRNRYFDDLVIIDSMGQRFRVVRAEIVPPLSTVARVVARVLNQRLRVDLHLEHERSQSLDDAKNLVKVWLDRAPDFWEASRDIDEWRRAVDSVSSARQLVALFS